MSYWPLTPLGEVLRLVVDGHPVHADKSYPNFGIYSFGRGLFRKAPISGTATSASTLYRARTGLFIYSRLFAFEGAYGIVTSEYDGCFVSNEYPMFECDPKRLDSGYLKTYFRTPSVWEEASKLASGMGDRRRRIQPEQLMHYTIPLPPMDVQRHLVAKIDDLATKIQEATKARLKLRDDLRQLKWTSISQVIESLSFDGKFGDVLLDKPRNGWSAKCDGLDTGTAVLSLGAVTGYRYRPNQFKWTSETTDPKAHYWLKEGDLLITRSNTPELVGHAAIYNGQPGNCIYPDLMMRLNVNERLANKRFVLYLLRSGRVREYIQRNANGSSPTMKKITQGTVLGIPFPSTVSLPVQAKIVEEIDRLEERMQEVGHLQDRSAEQLEALLPAILNQAFRGQLS